MERSLLPATFDSIDALSDAILTAFVSISYLRIVTIHISYDNLISGEKLHSKLSLVDLAGSESLNMEDDKGERVTEVLHVMKSLSAYVLLAYIFSSEF